MDDQQVEITIQQYRDQQEKQLRAQNELQADAAFRMENPITSEQIQRKIAADEANKQYGSIVNAIQTLDKNDETRNRKLTNRLKLLNTVNYDDYKTPPPSTITPEERITPFGLPGLSSVRLSIIKDLDKMVEMDSDGNYVLYWKNKEFEVSPDLYETLKTGKIKKGMSEEQKVNIWNAYNEILKEIAPNMYNTLTYKEQRAQIKRDYENKLGDIPTSEADVFELPKGEETIRNKKRYSSRTTSPPVHPITQSLFDDSLKYEDEDISFGSGLNVMPNPGLRLNILPGDKLGQYGRYRIPLEELGRKKIMKLISGKGIEEHVIPVSSGVLHLLTNPCREDAYRNGIFNVNDLQKVRELIDTCGVKVDTAAKRTKLSHMIQDYVDGGFGVAKIGKKRVPKSMVGSGNVIVQNPFEIEKYLKRNILAMKGGNGSDEIKKETKEYADYLVKKNMLDEDVFAAILEIT
eukprot:GCRY01004395.1.p1 GENE.GCRY01004395.1~~GCRY01004395.1.p1  ORF type:complete len:462 (-),score=28.82 GCRY01004395.1:2460-3845(-)